MNESAAVPKGKPQKYSPAVTDHTDTNASAYERKETEDSNGTVSRTDGEGPARQRVF